MRCKDTTFNPHFYDLKRDKRKDFQQTDKEKALPPARAARLTRIMKIIKDYALISTSTPLGSSRRIRASIVLVVGP